MMMKNLLMIFLIALSSTSVQAASFDCSKATHQEEKTVCNTPKLSQLDDQMAILYFEARKKTTDLNAFERNRTNWILQKRTCESDVVCLERSYLQRIAVLEQLSQGILSNTSASASSAPTGQIATAERNQSGVGRDDGYAAKVRACISPGVSFSAPPRTSSNPAAQYRISLKPDGQIADVRLTKSSGNSNFDRAVETGIRRCTPFTRPSAGTYPGYIDVNYNMYNGESAPTTSSSISFPPTGQGSQLSQLNGEWYSTQWKYGYTLTNGVGVATSTNSPNFKVGDRIIFLQQSSDKTFEGTQVYTDGKFYKITVQQQSNDTLLFKGEKNVSWTMTRIGQATALSVAPLTTASSAPQRQSNLPQCQGTSITTWNMCFGAHTYPDGRKFFGEWKDGKRNGQGTTITANGSKYIGEFKDDLWHGRGTWENSDGSKYVGEFKGDKGNGQGTYTFSNGEKHVGEYKDGKLNGQGTLTFPDGAKYVGEFKDDKPNGQGTRTSSNGTVLQSGRWVNGIFVEAVSTSTFTAQATTNTTLATPSPVAPLAPVSSAPPSRRQLPQCQGPDPRSWNNCEGTARTGDGNMYRGEFRDGRANGYGTLEGNFKYVGEVRDGVPQGLGTYTISNAAYTGQFNGGSRWMADENFNGIWTIASPEGRVFFVGELKDRRPMGKGTVTLKNDNKYTGFFKRGVLVLLNTPWSVNYPNGDTYVGKLTIQDCEECEFNMSHLSGAKRNGQGVLTSTNGDKYVGEFKNDMKHGQGQGISTYQDGSKYVGPYKDGRRHGQGTLTYLNGDKYVGNWQNDYQSGQGTFTATNGDKYIGEFKDGRRYGQGQGISTHQDGSKYVGPYRDGGRSGQGTQTTSTGDTYVGDWTNDKRNGRGTLTSSNGDKYVGEWKDDSQYGQGTFTASNGDKYVGEFKNGKRHGDGQGVSTYPDGSKYVGPFKDGMRHTNLAPYGQGTLTASNGDTYVGEWKDDKRNGQGTSTTFTGDKYVGDWVNDKRNGKGTFTSTRDGAKYVGDWKDDVRQGQGTLTFADGRIETGTWRSDVYISEAELARERAAVAEQERIAKERIAEQERLAKERLAEQERIAKEQLIKENNLIYGTTGVGLKLENVNQTNAASGRKWFVTATVRNNQKQTVKNLKLDCKQYNPQNVEVKNVDAVVIRETVVSEVVPSGELRNINFDLDWNRGSTYIKCLVISSSPN